MTREERDLHGLIVNGSDHLTAYNLYAEAVNQHGYSARSTGCRVMCSKKGSRSGPSGAGCSSRRSRTRRSVWRSVYRSIELPLPKQLPYAGEGDPRGNSELLARVHAVRPGDRRAYGRRPGGARFEDVGGRKLGSGGGQASILRRRSGTPRAAIEGTTLAVRSHSEVRAVGATASVGGRAEETSADYGVARRSRTSASSSRMRPRRWKGRCPRPSFPRPSTH